MRRNASSRDRKDVKNSRSLWGEPPAAPHTMICATSMQPTRFHVHGETQLMDEEVQGLTPIANYSKEHRESSQLITINVRSPFIMLLQFTVIFRVLIMLPYTLKYLRPHWRTAMIIKYDLRLCSPRHWGSSLACTVRWPPHVLMLLPYQQWSPQVTPPRCSGRHPHSSGPYCSRVATAQSAACTAPTLIAHRQTCNGKHV